MLRCLGSSGYSPHQKNHQKNWTPKNLETLSFKKNITKARRNLKIAIGILYNVLDF